MRALAIAAAIAAAAAGPNAAAAQVAAASAPGSAYEDPNGAYSFVLPEGWVVAADPAEPQPGAPRDLLLRDSWETGAACRISVAELPELARLDPDATHRLNEASHSPDALADALRRSGPFSGIRALSSERLAISGENAGYAQLAYISADDGAFRPMMAHSAAFFRTGTVHAITCGGGPNAGGEARRAFDAIAATYRAR